MEEQPQQFNEEQSILPSNVSEEKTVSLENNKVEYVDIGYNQRHWGNLRFHSLTVFIATTGGLFAISFQSSQLSNQMQLVLKIGAILITCVFWMLDERIFKYWINCVNRAAELDKLLGFQQWTNRPSRKGINSRFAIRLLFFIFLVFWVISLIT